MLQKQGSGMFSGAAWWRCVCDTGMNRFLMFDSSGEASLEGFRPSDSSDCLITSRSCLIIGLTNGEYWFFSLSRSIFFHPICDFLVGCTAAYHSTVMQFKKSLRVRFLLQPKTSLKPLSAPSHLHVFKPAATCEWKRPRLSLRQQRVSTALQLTQKNKQERKKTSTQRRVRGGLFLLLFFLMETDGFAYRARARVWVCVACPY